MTLSKEKELLLDAWASGDLGGAEEESVREFLNRSREATEWVAQRKALLSQLRGLPLSVQPESDLWKGIEARLEDGPWTCDPDVLADGPFDLGPVEVGHVSGEALRESTKAPWKAMLAAAAVLVALAVGFSFGQKQWGEGGGSGDGRAVSMAPRNATAADVALASMGEELPLVAKAEVSLIAAKLELRRALDSHRERLPKAALATVDENLATIERAIAEIRAALAMHPGDAGLRRTLVAYHEREVALLFQITRAGARLELNERSAS